MASSNHNVYSRDPGSGALLWSTTLDDNIYSSPIIANGLVYVNSGRSLVALSEANGVSLWRASVYSYFPASPVVGDGIVFIASYDGNLYAFSEGGRAPSSRLPGGDLGVKPALSSLKPDLSLKAGRT
jgi:outer membrane protein assembly factor BamB